MSTILRLPVSASCLLQMLTKIHEIMVFFILFLFAQYSGLIFDVFWVV